MGWDSGSRLSLKFLRAAGVIAVRYEAEGCNVKLELLTNCIAKGTYQYVPYSANEQKVAHDANELYAQLPVGAASLTGKIAGSRALRTDYMLVGLYALPPGMTFSRSDLKGTCDRATHVVSAMYVGGFAMVTGASQTIDAATTVFGVGAGGATSANVQTVANEGIASACKEAQDTEKPKSSCDVPLRIGLLPLGAATPPPGAHPTTAAAPATTAPPPKTPTPAAVPTTPPAASKPVECPAGMAAIPGGTFTPGDKGGPVTVAPYCLDVTEVTVKAYATCFAMGSCSEPDRYINDGWNKMCNWGPAGRDNYPINCVTWDQAKAYCEARGRRLATEEEWEWAARGGANGWKYPWGNELPSAARLNGCGAECPPNLKAKGLGTHIAAYVGSDGYPETAPVGSFPAGGFGLFDMVGNVAEWTSSNYSANSGTYVSRGGGWSSEAALLSVSARLSRPPSTVAAGLGFRCARTP